MEAEALKYFIACVTAAGFGIAKVTVTMLIGLAMIESLCIYALVVSLILIYAAPMTKTVTAIFGS
jgi:F-type H+-transporting ATPase subunit c